MFNLGILQFVIEYKNPESNRKKVAQLVSNASSKSFNMLVLPETWTTGYSEDVFYNVKSYAEREDDRLLFVARIGSRE